MKRTAIIAAGGTGVRMKAPLPKQFLLLDQRPLLMHTIDAFMSAKREMNIVVVLPQSYQFLWKQLCEQYRFTTQHQVIDGGSTRFHSIKNALKAIPDFGYVAIHDGARPLVSPSLIRNLFREAEQYGTAIPAIPVSDSIRNIRRRRSFPLKREDFRIIQTPQVFKTKEISKAYCQRFRKSFTDDATVYESHFGPIHLVDGEFQNIKITSQEDLLIAEFLLHHKTC